MTVQIIIIIPQGPGDDIFSGIPDERPPLSNKMLFEKTLATKSEKDIWELTFLLPYFLQS